MFLSTLGLSTDKSVKTALSKSNGSVTNDFSDKRGSNARKISEDVVKKIINHVSKFNPSISHYRRAHAPNRL